MTSADLRVFWQAHAASSGSQDKAIVAGVTPLKTRLRLRRCSQSGRRLRHRPGRTAAELMNAHSRKLNSYSLLAGPVPCRRSFLAPAGGSTLNQRRRVLGSSAASWVLTQLAMETWTLASPDHGWLSTASTIVPSLTMWSRPPTRDWLLRMFWVPTRPARPATGIGGGAGRQVVVGLAEPIDAVVGHAGHFGIGAADGVDVVGAALGLEELGAEERRVADDDVGFRPGRGCAVGVDQGVGGDEVRVEVVQRQGVSR